MSTTVTSSDVQKNFGAYHDRALTEPVKVTKYGRETVYIISAQTFHALKQAQREAIAATDLNDHEIALIEAAEIPEGHRYTMGQ
ncbi:MULTISPECIES: type II toxin-antitoxin system Phd/YefM family antitoxin [Acetobacteraceae]|uniref:Antitoxin n=2 Tax=Acetobacteraceae TaxID=433 RepID=A0A023DAA6_ACIMT|nr:MULTISPECIES: type II toxin-antitoxin system Phd/YefM family antitoxin [Acetobacteraceae]MBB6458103.1 PHD/YefM family antitoxin component YafN of YafNO toxin-antitoxin module [Acetobacter lovaniensis]MBU2653069.1 type II toxin-antitoxin system Phd/YefM family antitoxin [Acidomonas methanolica]NHN82357.1 type II toxin-antitoxin system Phd/YefM family antitoxin [Acetobacter lovaniensis]NSL92818.1 type II toxin-antitoxin system Phd/YefM family antitoxin [Acetobacter syzygii]TCS27186.1 antitoxi